MYTLTAEQAKTLIQHVLSKCEKEHLSHAIFAEAVHNSFENIPGFETIPLEEADSIITQLWGIVMSKNEALVEAVAKPKDSKTPESPSIVDLAKPTIKKAIADGKALIAEGKTKADAARAMYPQISTESKESIVAAFVEGATLTPKGAQTYWYNCRRKASKEQKTA